MKLKSDKAARRMYKAKNKNGGNINEKQNQDPQRRQKAFQIYRQRQG